MRLPPSSSPSPCRSTWSTGRGSGGRNRVGSCKKEKLSGIFSDLWPTYLSTYFSGKTSLSSPASLQHFVDQADLELAASRMMGLTVHTTRPAP